MRQQHGKRSVFALMLACTIAVTEAPADQRFITQDSEGFCTTLPYLEKEAIARHIQESRLRMNERKLELEKRVKNQRFSVLDVAITLVMPGGLLYAAVKRGSQLKERKTLSLVTQDIKQLSGDLLTFQSADSNLRIAAVQ